MTKNIFVVGLDPFNYRKPGSIATQKTYNFHLLLDVKEVKNRGILSIEDLVSQAAHTLNPDFPLGKSSNGSH
jgi:hypothetical protein